MNRRLSLCLGAVLVVGACSKHRVITSQGATDAAATRKAEPAGLLLRKASPAEGLAGELTDGDARIFFDVHRRDTSDPVVARDPDAGRSAQARIRDRRGITIWGVGSGVRVPEAGEGIRPATMTSAPSPADIELVKVLPNVLRKSSIDVRVLALELEALEGASAAFRGVAGAGGPAPRAPSNSVESSR